MKTLVILFSFFTVMTTSHKLNAATVITNIDHSDGASPSANPAEVGGVAAGAGEALAPATAAAQSPFACRALSKHPEVLKLTADFAQDLLSREPKDSKEVIVDRLSTIMALMNDESGYDSGNVTDMHYRTNSLSKGVALDGMRDKKGGPISMNSQTNFGLLQMSADRFAIDPKDSLRALASITGRAILVSDDDPKTKGSRYFKSANQSYQKFFPKDSSGTQLNPDVDTMMNRCETNSFFKKNPKAAEELKTLSNSFGMLGQYQSSIAKSVAKDSTDAGTKNAVVFFGKLMAYCPRLNMELAYNEFLKNRQNKYFESLKNGKHQKVCEKELAAYLNSPAATQSPAENKVASSSSASEPVPARISSSATPTETDHPNTPSSADLWNTGRAPANGLSLATGVGLAAAPIGFGAGLGSTGTPLLQPAEVTPVSPELQAEAKRLLSEPSATEQFDADQRAKQAGFKTAQEKVLNSHIEQWKSRARQCRINSTDQKSQDACLQKIHDELDDLAIAQHTELCAAYPLDPECKPKF